MATDQQTVEGFDVKRYMGDWNVIAVIPTPFDGLNNPVEHYTWNEKEERVDVRYTFNQGTVNGPEKCIPQKAFVTSKSSEWKIKFPYVPFIRGTYLVLDINESYSEVVVGVPNKKYAWIMARAMTMPRENLEKHTRKLASLGYDISKLKYPVHQRSEVVVGDKPRVGVIPVGDGRNSTFQVDRV